MTISSSYISGLGDPAPMLRQIFEGLEAMGVDVSTYELDHVCYRVANRGTYEEKKEVLRDFGECLTESLINGRPIATFKLHKPLEYGGKKIALIELPAPKEGTSHLEGFQHAEFVIDLSFDDFIRAHPKVVFDLRGAFKKINPEIKISLGAIEVKFHHKSLEEIIRLETQGRL